MIDRTALLTSLPYPVLSSAESHLITPPPAGAADAGLVRALALLGLLRELLEESMATTPRADCGRLRVLRRIRAAAACRFAATVAALMPAAPRIALRAASTHSDLARRRPWWLRFGFCTPWLDVWWPWPCGAARTRCCGARDNLVSPSARACVGAGARREWCDRRRHLQPCLLPWQRRQ